MANSYRKLCLPTQSPNTWTLFASSLSLVCMFPDFLLWQPSSIVILLTLNSLQTPLHSGPKRSQLVSQFPSDFTILVGNCKYNQNVATLTCGSGAVAGSGMVGTDPFMRVSVEAKPALYWLYLLKQSEVKWLAHTYKLTPTEAGMLSLKMKRNHCLFYCSIAGTEYRHWFLQPTTE